MPRPKQETLPGTPKGIPELEKIGLEIAEIDADSFKLRGRRQVLVDQAVPLMKQNRITIYKVEDITMQMKLGKDTLKVTKKGEEHENADAQ